MLREQLKPNIVLRGPIFPEPVQVIVAVPLGEAVKVVAKGLKTGHVHEPVLSVEQLASLEASPEKEPFDGDAHRFRLGIEALRLGLAYEYDRYFSLSIARVDPLPHQLEAVYDYFIKAPRIRFLLADDPGAGKTIMAGLLLKELKIRGLIKRTLIVTPANLSFQWQRELKDKFREHFEVVRSDVLRANYGMNPWQDKNQVITSVSWVSRVEDANESLLRSQWDLVIVDEAHKMSAASRDKKTLAYELGEELAKRTDHYLLMTATPHKGDPKNFCLFLELLDRDVYADVKSLEEAMRRQQAPFYLRRVKEALVTFPDPDTGQVKTLFTKRNVRTTEFAMTDAELDFYDALTRYVEDQSIKAAQDDSARGRALSFTMAMLQRRFASSVYAIRRSLERMKEKREKILADPEGYREEQKLKRVPEDFDDLPEDERQKILDELESVVASIDPLALREEILQLSRLIEHARLLEQREHEQPKLAKLKEVLTQQGVFKEGNLKLLVFTEHKETLDYLAGDGKGGRPLGKLRDLKECVWRTYKHVLLLGKDNALQAKDLGLVHSSAASDLTSFILNRLRQDGDIEEAVSPTFLARHWPPAFKEWSTKAVRDAFFASPQFPRLLKPDSLKETIARGVEGKTIGYVGKSKSGRYEPFHFGDSLNASEVEISDEMFLVTGEEAEKHIEPPRLSAIQVTPAQVTIEPGKKQTFQAKGLDQHGRDIETGKVTWTATGGTIDADGVFLPGPDEGNFVITAKSGTVSGTAQATIVPKGMPFPPPPSPPPKGKTLSWGGQIPPQKWMNFYTKVLSKFSASKNTTLTVHVRVEVTSDDGISKEKVEETKVALRELGLDHEVTIQP